MSVYKRQWKGSNGKKKQGWVCDNWIAQQDGTKRQVRKLFKTQGEAQDYEASLRLGLSPVQATSQGPMAVVAHAPTEVSATPNVADFAPRFLAYSESENKPSETYTKRYILRLHLEPAFRQPLDRIGKADIDAYKAAKLKAGVAKKTVNNHLAVLRKLLNLAEEYKVIASTPKLRALKLEEQDFTFLDFDETDRLLAVIPARWRPMVFVALRTGLRIGELLALKWEDIDLKAGRLVVKRTLWNGQENAPKGGKRREIPLSRATVGVLQSIRSLREYVFTTPEGVRLTHSMVKDVVPSACKLAGLSKRATFHDLRHTFASHLVMRGRSLKEVQELLGHSTIAMTMRYAHLAPDVKKDAVEALDGPVLGSPASAIAQEQHMTGA